jgi:hypothetical protein
MKARKCLNAQYVVPNSGIKALLKDILLRLMSGKNLLHTFVPTVPKVSNVLRI